MSSEMIISNLITVLASALGAGIGGFFAFQVAIYQIKAGRKNELEKTITPFLFEIKLQCEKAKGIRDEIEELKHKKIPTDSWNKKCIDIIKAEKYRIDDSYPNWNKICSEFYMYSFSIDGTDTLFHAIENLIFSFRYLSRAQSNAEKYVAQDITCSKIDEEYKKIVKTIEKIQNKDIRNKFCGSLIQEK